MSCKHAEEVCQDCLEKVHTTKEDAPPKRSPPEKTMTPGQKRKYILLDSALLAAFGAAAYFNTKLFLKTSVFIFNSSLQTVDYILDTIATRTRKE